MGLGACCLLPGPMVLSESCIRCSCIALVVLITTVQMGLIALGVMHACRRNSDVLSLNDLHRPAVKLREDPRRPPPCIHVVRSSLLVRKRLATTTIRFVLYSLPFLFLYGVRCTVAGEYSRGKTKRVPARPRIDWCLTTTTLPIQNSPATWRPREMCNQGRETRSLT